MSVFISIWKENVHADQAHALRKEIFIFFIFLVYWCVGDNELNVIGFREYRHSHHSRCTRKTEEAIGERIVLRCTPRSSNTVRCTVRSNWIRKCVRACPMHIAHCTTASMPISNQWHSLSCIRIQVLIRLSSCRIQVEQSLVWWHCEHVSQ